MSLAGFRLAALRRHAASILLALAVLAPAADAARAESCPALRVERQVPRDLDLCASLESKVRRPGWPTEQQYRDNLAAYLGGYCHRNPSNGWVTDKRIRDAGPFVGRREFGRWSGQMLGTHAPVMIWYSPEMYRWMRENRPDHSDLPEDAIAVPDGAMMVKEMFPAPGAVCMQADPDYLEPTSGAAVMVRASAQSHDGWFWGWFGFSKHEPDWPATAANGYPNLGFGQYCLNCHGSAKSNATFASLRNVKGHPGEPLVFLSQTFFLNSPDDNHHLMVAKAPPEMFRKPAAQPGDQPAGYQPDFLRAFGGARPVLPDAASVSRLASETYDNAWAMPGSRLASLFLTSDQCMGCHAAGSTGLQFDMTAPRPGHALENLSPWATWRSSPMGLAGRDPFFFSQVESEITHFHPGSAAAIQDICFGCHAVAGQRQHALDRKAESGACGTFERGLVDATPLDADAQRDRARIGALARDGVTCLACHRIALGTDAAAHEEAPQNSCVADRQAALNPGLTGFARTFTGAFPVAGLDQVFGPFEAPKTKPMRNAVGLVPEHRTAIRSSEICGSCHTVHLPVLKNGRVIAHAYEQATYAEWLFSDYRSGEGVAGPLPSGPGANPQSCQACHMQGRDAEGRPIVSKIASIQEYTNFPQAENVLPARDIDLAPRSGFSPHTLVGLNIWLIKMAEQFSAVLGIRTEDPMLPRGGDPPLKRTERAILDQARHATADIAVGQVSRDGGLLRARVSVRNKAGHKFPSGVGFRRAFLEFTVRDAAGRVLWASGRTDAAGIIRDEAGQPVAGELWWDRECKARLAPEQRLHQSHFQTVRKQSQVQIYQELVAAPGDEAEPVCGDHAAATGPLTTSFLSVCRRVKDNRILPDGYLPIAARADLARAIGADAKLAEETGSVGVDGDPDYVSGGGDTIGYEIPLADMAGEPQSVEATLYYQAQPPFYLQDRFCTGRGRDTDRLFLLAGQLRQEGTESESWKLKLVGSGPVPVP
ncbi:hypothetical protein [Enterovirga sp.]|uniref:hypothetical protein n=1 Tax=Enterovirga sp. TaxID=2026350 RepID=UPI002623F8BC|nr:hypothetical protein [Enterovirga sp.]MDB5592172.1 hypothetical protein [Enterovirga sp.]